MRDFYEITASISECCIIVSFCNRFLGFQKAEKIWPKSALFLILLCVENILLSQLKGFELFSVVLLMLTVFTCSMLFLKGKVYEKILISVLLPIMVLLLNQFIIIVLCTAAKCPVMDVIEPGGALRLPVLFFSKFAFFIVCERLIALRKPVPYSLGRFQWIILLLCFFSTFLIAVSIWNFSRELIQVRSKFFLIYAMIAVLNILMYMLLHKMQYDNAEREKQKISEIKLAAQEKFVEEAREHYAEIRTLRHDMRHCLMTAAKLLSDGRTEEARSYMERLAEDKVNFTAAGVDTGNVVVDAVINNKIADCSRRNIEMKCLIDSHFEGISEIDMSILLSNVLENAISGCAGAKEPRIELIIGTRMAFTYMIVRNSIPASVLADNPELTTSREDKLVHGFGIESVRRIAEKYDGSVGFREENGFFIAEIWLKNSK